MMPDSDYNESYYERNTMVSAALASIRELYKEIEPAIVNHIFFGRLDIHPRHLSVAIAFKNDDKLAKARKSGLTDLLKKELSYALREAGYPVKALRRNYVDFVSEETVNKQGGPWIYFR